MKKAPTFILIALCLAGCSMPTTAAYKELHSFTKEIKENKVPMGGKSKSVLLQDFRQNDIYEEDIAALKAEVEKYILSRAELSDAVKENLRQLKVTAGLTRQEVELLLGKPDKLSLPGNQSKYGASEIWIYKINKMRAYTVFIIPVAVVHEGYYLYFKDDLLKAIERHFLRQTVQQSAAPGVFGSDTKVLGQ